MALLKSMEKHRKASTNVQNVRMRLHAVPRTGAFVVQQNVRLDKGPLVCSPWLALIWAINFTQAQFGVLHSRSADLWRQGKRAQWFIDSRRAQVGTPVSGTGIRQTISYWITQIASSGSCQYLKRKFTALFRSPVLQKDLLVFQRCTFIVKLTSMGRFSTSQNTIVQFLWLAEFGNFQRQLPEISELN